MQSLNFKLEEHKDLILKLTEKKSSLYVFVALTELCTNN